MFQSFRNFKFLKRTLLTYWLLLICAFFLFLPLLAYSKNLSILELLNQNLGITLAVLFIFILLIQSYLLFILTRSSEQESSLLKQFILFSLIQQLFTFNILGCLITFLLYLSLKESSPVTTSKKSETIPFYTLLGFVTFLTILVVYGRSQLF